MADILPFRRLEPPTGLPAYDAGVVPFDRTNPSHVSAWNALFAFGRSARRFDEGRR